MYKTSYVSEIKNNVDLLLSSPLDIEISEKDYFEYFLTGNRLNFEKKYFEKRRQLAVYALGMIIGYRSLEIKDQLIQVIHNICEEYSWCLPAHLPVPPNERDYSNYPSLDLFSAETAQALSEIQFILSNQLGDEIKRKIFTEISRRVLDPFVNQLWAFESLENNWSSVIASCIGMTSIYYKDQIDTQYKTIMKKVNRMLNTYLRGFLSDGGCLEGVGYWNYGFGYFCYFIELFENENKANWGGNQNLICRIANFPQNVQLSNGEFVPFSDAHNNNLSLGLIAYCNAKYGSGLLQSQESHKLFYDPCYRWAQAYRDLAWTRKYNIVENENLNLQPFKILPMTEWFISNNGLRSFAAQFGNNNVSHNHNDVGNFILLNNENVFLTDLGAGEYTKDYFDEDHRYSILNNRSSGHNVPIVNGYEQLSGNYSANDFYYNANSLRFELSSKIERVYPEEANLIGLKRTFNGDRSLSHLKLKDEFCFRNENNVIIENFITPMTPHIINNAEVEVGGLTNSLIIHSFKPVDKINIECCDYSNHEGEKSEVYRIQFLYYVKNNIESINFSFEMREV